MRNVPLELKQKLLKQFYGNSADNLPQIQVIAKQASINTLITEIIHEGIPANFGDVAIRQLPGENQPSLAYAACIDNGTGNICSRKMPAFAEQDWEFVWSLGAVKDIAIEFDGKWHINPKKRFYELFTEQTPYIFFTDNSNNLYVQIWSDASTRLLLANNVSQISVCRGWQSTLDTGVDQGLIIGYLRSGKVFYRAYCQQSTGEYIWETENEVTELGSGNTTLCVFRTNDFRVGFLTENSGQMKYVLSHRTYAGQAMPPEYALGWAQDAKVWLDKLTTHNTILNENAVFKVDKPYLACYDANTPALEITDHQRIGLREFIITFNRPVDGVPGAFENYFTTLPSRAISSCTWQNGNQLRLVFGQDIGQSVPLILYVSECHEAWQIINGQKLLIEAAEFVLEGIPIQTIHRETVSIDIISGMSVAEMSQQYAYFNENVTVYAEGTVTLPPVGVVPI